jgi:hypothetical protein
LRYDCNFQELHAERAVKLLNRKAKSPPIGGLFRFS